MQLFNDFPPGLWLVKRIDRFHFSHNDSESALVDVDMQKLPFEKVASLHCLSQEAIAELLGKPPGSSNQPNPPIRRWQMLAGYLGLLQAGDVIEAGRKISKLPTQRATIEISTANRPKDIRFADGERYLEKPPTWSQGIPYRVLNSFEYLMATGLESGYANPNLHITRTRCLVIQYGDVEYILPKMVVFQAFYCLNSRLINALCNKAWPDAAGEVISFHVYDSGIGTRVDPETGAWDIVLTTGMDRDFGSQLALYWFDPFARACITALYTEALADSQVSQGAHGRGWLASANIPHALRPTPLKLDVEGYVLRKYRPNSKEKDRRRFLITSILGSSWPLKDQVIRVELHNSGEKGEEQVPAPEDRPYQHGQSSVEGDPNAMATSNADPLVTSATNVFRGSEFKYFDAPKPEKQPKKTSKIYASGAPPMNDGPSTVVSAGTPNYSAAAPPKASVVKSARDPSQQFDLLMRMMDRLLQYGVIDTFKVCAPDDPTYLVQRNGLCCWTLVSAECRISRTLPRSGWELIKVKRSGGNNPTERPTFNRYPRCVLILSIKIEEVSIIIFEIEPRPTERSRFRLVGFVQQNPIESRWVGPTLDAIRKCEGTFELKQVGQIFSSLTDRPPQVRKHAHRRAISSQVNQLDNSELNEHVLGDWFLSLAESAGGDCRSRKALLDNRPAPH